MRKRAKAKMKAKAPLVLAPLDVNQRYSVAEALRYLRQSRFKFYEDVGAGVIKTIKHGGRRFVPGSEIARLSRLPA